MHELPPFGYHPDSTYETYGPSFAPESSLAWPRLSSRTRSPASSYSRRSPSSQFKEMNQPMWDRIRGFVMAVLTTPVLMSADAGPAAAGAAPEPAATPLREVAAFQAAAARNRAILTLPRFEKTPAEIEATTRAAIAEATAKLDALAAQDPAKASFASTVAALDDVLYPVGAAAYRISLMKETQPDAAMRDAATAQYQALQEWSVGVTYREDVFKAVKAFADAYEAGQRPR